MKEFDDEFEILMNDLNKISKVENITDDSVDELVEFSKKSTDLVVGESENLQIEISIFQKELKEAVLCFENGELEKCNEYLENFTYELESFLEQPLFKYFQEKSDIKNTILANSEIEKSYLMLAVSYIKLELYKKAKFKLLKGINYYPQNADMRNMLSKCHIMLKEPEEARILLERGIFLGETDAMEIFETLWKPNFSFEYFIDVVMDGDKEKVAHFIENGMDINLQNTEGRTALIYASYLGLKDIANLLIRSGADLEIVDKKNKSAFVYAVEKKDVDLMQLLMSYGAKTRLDDLTVKEKIKEFVDDDNVRALNLLFAQQHIEKADVDISKIDESIESSTSDYNDVESLIASSEEPTPSRNEIAPKIFTEEADWETSLKKIPQDEEVPNIGEKSDFTNILGDNNLVVESNTQENKANYVNKEVFHTLSEKPSVVMENRQKEMLGAINDLISNGIQSSAQIQNYTNKKKSFISTLFSKKIKTNNFIEFISSGSKKEIDKFLYTQPIDTKDKSGNTILLAAIQLEDIGLIEQIFTLMPDVQIKNRAGQNIEDLIVQVRIQNREFIEKIYENYLSKYLASKEPKLGENESKKEKTKRLKEETKRLKEETKRLKEEKKALAKSKKENKLHERKAGRKNSE